LLRPRCAAGARRLKRRSLKDQRSRSARTGGSGRSAPSRLRVGVVGAVGSGEGARKGQDKSKAVWGRAAGEEAGVSVFFTTLSTPGEGG